MSFHERLEQYLTEDNLSVYNWNSFIRFLEANSSELTTLSRRNTEVSCIITKRIFEKLEDYRLKYSTPSDVIRPEDINPQIYKVIS